ncbi:MAG: ABC transporter ATP-binding protein [Methyloprofundus sp.]|nr:ABC transporter ATP-binding protein [Methyloprofundus sp.]
MSDTNYSYQFNQVEFSYYANQPSLSLDRLDIAAGKTTALIGANGSGKSTLLNILAFLEPISQGELLFNQQLVNKKQLIDYRRQVGFLAQKPFMLYGTVYDNIDLALKIHKKKQRSEKIKQILKQVDISHCEQKIAKQLSGGELQKVALARMLVLEPKVLLLDEPFSYLDQNSAESLESFLHSYSEQTGNTLIFSTHDRLQGYALADNVVALASGKQVLTPLINLFHGRVKNGKFYSEHLCIDVGGGAIQGLHASIKPRDIILSTDELGKNSMRNRFQGRVVVIAEERGNVRINIDAGEIFKAIITFQALKDLNLVLGDRIWVNFKSNAVVVF